MDEPKIQFTKEQAEAFLVWMVIIVLVIAALFGGGR